MIQKWTSSSFSSLGLGSSLPRAWDPRASLTILGIAHNKNALLSDRVLRFQGKPRSLRPVRDALVRIFLWPTVVPNLLLVDPGGPRSLSDGCELGLDLFRKVGGQKLTLVEETCCLHRRVPTGSVLHPHGAHRGQPDPKMGHVPHFFTPMEGRQRQLQAQISPRQTVRLRAPPRSGLARR